MTNRVSFSNFGVYVFAAAAIGLGLLGLVSGDFATGWQRVAASVPHRHLLADLAAAYELLAGAALFWRRAARAAALALAALYGVFVLLWVAPIFAAPGVYDGWGNFFEELSLVVGALVLFAALAPPASPWTRRARPLARLLGICAISFGLDHLFSLSAAAAFVPRWIPPGQMFWAVTTAICFLAAAAALLSGVLAALAARLLTLMIVLLSLLVWLPLLFTASVGHFVWAGNAISWAIGGAAWVVADALRPSRQPSPTHPAPAVSART